MFIREEIKYVINRNGLELSRAQKDFFVHNLNTSLVYNLQFGWLHFGKYNSNKLLNFQIHQYLEGFCFLSILQLPPLFEDYNKISISFTHNNFRVVEFDD